MAVRNIEAIERKAEQMAKEKQSVADMRRASLKVYLDSIKAKSQDMTDAVDTYEELLKRKIPCEFQSGTRIRFAPLPYKGGHKIKIEVGEESGYASFAYIPEEEAFMTSTKSSDTKFKSIDDLSDSDISSKFHSDGSWKERSDNMRQAIKEFAEGIEVFLNDFFNYVEHL